MKFKPTNTRSYLQVLISFLLLMSIFLPYLNYDYNDAYGISGTSSAISEFSSILTDDEDIHIGLFFAAFVILQFVNIFIQSKKSNAFVAILAGAAGILSILISNNKINEIKLLNEDFEITYDWGFYIFIALMALQILTPIILLLAKQNREVAAVENKKDVIANSDLEKELLENELRILKEKAEQLEREKIEKERLEQERIEKEKLRNEIARLKELLASQEQNPESNA